MRSVVVDMAESTPALDQARDLMYRAETLLERYERDNQLADLDQALDAQRTALSLVPETSDQFPAYQDALGMTLAGRYLHSGDPGCMEEAIALHQEASERARGAPEMRMGVLYNLGMDYWNRYARERSSQDLELALDAWTRSAEVAPADHPRAVEPSFRLADGLDARYSRDRALDDLRAAITVRHQAMLRVPGSYPGLLVQYDKVGIDLVALYVAGGDPAVLERAISMLDTGVKIATATGSDQLPRLLNNLGVATLHRYERTRDLADLDETVEALEAAVAATPEDSPDRPLHLQALANALDERRRHTGQARDGGGDS
jgi:tetratricopeptide (TPR) repeat protein